MKRLYWLVLICLMAMYSQQTFAQVQGGDILNEAPLHPLPAEMTYEEYKDMNRRLTVGLALAAIPVPGMIHFYAGEKKTGWKILGGAVLGLGGVISGVAMAEDGDFPDSDFEVLTLNAGDEDKERRFEQIPVEIEGGEINYELREIYREPDGTGGALIAAGAVLLVGSIVYDFIHGIRTIEEKRDRVRYKYGKQMQFGLAPQIDLKKQSVGLGLALNF